MSPSVTDVATQPIYYDPFDPEIDIDPHPVWARMREEAPVWWNEQAESIFDDGGYWVISRHEDIKAISRDSDRWSTNRKGVVMRLPEGTDAEQLELTKALLINHDAPEHTRLRQGLSSYFTPGYVARWEGRIREVVELTDYAVQMRYPGEYYPVTEEEYVRAIELADRVVKWVRRELGLDG